MSRLVAVLLSVAALLATAIFWAMSPASAPPTPKVPPFALTLDSPYRIFRIGGERIGPWNVCGERPQLGQGTWGSEGQVCVFVMKGNWPRAVACGTQMFVVDTGQACQ